MSKQTIALLLILGLVAVSVVEASQRRNNNNDKDDDDKDDDKDKCMDKDCPYGMKCYNDECRLYCEKSGYCDSGAKECEMHHGHEYCPGDEPKKPKIPKCGGIEWCKKCEEVKVVTEGSGGGRRLQTAPVTKREEYVVSCKECKSPAYKKIYKESDYGYGDDAYTCVGPQKDKY